MAGDYLEKQRKKVVRVGNNPLFLYYFLYLVYMTI